MPRQYNAGSQAGRKRRIMRALKINEISGVDSPAQEGAVAVIMKRAGTARDNPQTEDGYSKRVWLTDDVDGHAHLVDDQTHDGAFRDGGDTSWSVSEGEEDNRGHSHPWVRNGDGTISIGRSDGHGHRVLETDKRATSEKAVGDPAAAGTEGDEDMTDKTKKADGAGPTVEELQAQLQRANAVAALSDAEKAHFGSLEGKDADDFLSKSAQDRKAIVDAAKRDADAKAAEADPVAYKTSDGVELRKSAGEALISMARSNDALRKQLDESNKRAEQAALEKRAEGELKHLPGTVQERAAMLRAIDGIGDEGQRKAALNALKAQDNALAAAFKTAGTALSPVPGSAEDTLDGLAKKHQEAHPEATYEQAYDAVLKTAAGRELYAKSVN